MLLLPKFEYFEPETIDEACSLLSQKEEACVLAGGTDLFVKMKQKTTRPRYIVNLKYISGLRYIDYDGKEGLTIGALTTLHDLEASSVIRQRFDVLHEAARTVASRQIRNMATIGGNLCNASPAADTAPPLIGLNARVKLAGPSGERIVPLEEFFTGPGMTLLKSDEILTEIIVSDPAPYTGGVYLKLSARKKDLAIVGVAATITLDSHDGRCKDLRIVLGAVAPTPMRARKAEEILRGKAIEDLIEQASVVAVEEACPIDDIRSTAEYRRQMVKVLVGRAVRQAAALAKSA